MADLKPEAVEAIKRLHEQGRVLMEALADLARQEAYEFRRAPGREFMDRSDAMRNVIRIRDAYTNMSHGARAALVALGRPAPSSPSIEREVSGEASAEGVPGAALDPESWPSAALDEARAACVTPCDGGKNG